MNEVHVTPEELRKFAAELNRINNEMKNNYTRLHDKLRRLGETWRDQEHKKFENEFNQTVRVINQFVSASEKYVPFLIRKAEAADEYLKRR